MKGHARAHVVRPVLLEGTTLRRKGIAVLAAVALLLADAAIAKALPVTGSTGGGQAHTNMEPFLALNYIISMQGLYPSRNSADVSGEGLASTLGYDPFIGEISIFAGNFAPRGWAQCDGQLLPINQYQSLYSILGTAYGGDGRTTFALPDLRGRVPIHPGSGPGLSTCTRGQRGGVNDVTLGVNQIPSHNHTLPWMSDLTLNTGGGQAHTNMQPFLGVNHIIGLQGLYPSRSDAGVQGEGLAGTLGTEPFIGEVSMFAGDFAPRGWALCDGQLLQISQNTALFSLVGTTYGGDGRTTVGLPELRGRVAIHEGQGPGLSNYRLGQKGGVENVSLSLSQLPSHDHSLPPTTLRTGNTGGGGAHTNVQPYQVLNYIISLYGVYPSRSSAEVQTEGEPLAAVGGGDPFVGEIALFAGNFAPRGWAFCDGQLLQVSQNDALFSLLGTLYGGDGRTTFGLPDLRSRAALHWGSGPGVDPWSLGRRDGQENVALAVTQMPSHTHEVPEPATGTLILLVSAGLALRRRRRRKA